MENLQCILKRRTSSREVPKSVFTSNIKNPKAKDYFNRFVSKIQWITTINNNDLKRELKREDNITFCDIQVFKIDVTTPVKLKELGKIIAQTIPHFCIILFKYHNKYKIFMYDVKKQNKGNEKVAKASYYISYWIYPELENIYPFIQDCLAISLSKEKTIHNLYSEIMKKALHLKNNRVTHKELTHELKFFFSIRNTEKLMEFCTEEYSKVYNLSFYDYGDIWYYLNCTTKGKEFLSRNQIGTIDELVEFLAYYKEESSEIYSENYDIIEYENNRVTLFNAGSFDINDFCMYDDIENSLICNY